MVFIVFITQNAVVCGHGKIELCDGRFFYRRDVLGEFSVHNMYSAESQRLCISCFPDIDSFAGLHILPAAELVLIRVEEKIAWNDYERLKWLLPVDQYDSQ